tara:strand:- start:450 stop:2195 length:1746 start_codon:yes stop_codon:yes gene_type:complete
MSIDQEIDNRKLALSGLNSQQLANRLKQSGGLLDALATQKILSQKEAFKRDMAMQMENSPKTIAQKNEEKLTQQSQMDIAEGVAGVLQNRKRRSDANAKMLAGIDPRKLKAMTKRPMGIPNAPVPRVQKAAQGGIVGFQAGNEVMGLSGMDRTGFGDPTIRMPDNILSEVPEMTEPGELIVDTTSAVGNWIMKNPSEAALLAVTAHPAMKAGQAAFKLSRGALNTIKNIIARNPKKTLGAGAVGAFVGQDVVNPALQNLPETMKSAGEVAMDIGKGIAALPKKAYTGARDLLGIESPGLFTPDAAPASMPQVDTTTTDAEPAVAPESVRDAQRMMDINEIPVAEDRMPLEERLKEIDKSKEKRPTIPTVNGDESRSELNQKDEQLNSGLSRLASILSTYARSDPRKPGGFTAAVDEYDQKLLDEKRKAQAMRLKERELEISSRLADIRASGIQSQFLLNRLKELDKNILSARETVYEGSEATLMGLKNQLTTLLDEKETFLGGLTSGVIGTSKEEIDTKIEKVRGNIAAEKRLMEIAVNEMAGDFIAERNQLNKYLKEYENYTGGDTKEDFNLKDQRTVGQ